MILIEYHVENPSGFHARPVSMLVKEACKYQSAITFEKNGKVINCKSMMSVLSAAVGNGEKLTFSVTGGDEAEAAPDFENFLESVFKEA